MTALQTALATALGTLGAGWHLSATYLRAKRAVEGRPILALVTSPISIGVPAVLLFLVAAWGLRPLLIAVLAFTVVELSALCRVRRRR